MESPIYEAARQKKENFENCIFLNFHFSAWARQCKGQSAKNVCAWNRQYKGQSAKNKHFKNWIFFPNFHGTAWNHQYKGQCAKNKKNKNCNF